MEVILVLLVLAYALLPLILLVLFIRSELRVRGLERDFRWLSRLVRDLGGEGHRPDREGGAAPAQHRGPSAPVERSSGAKPLQRPAGAASGRAAAARAEPERSVELEPTSDAPAREDAGREVARRRAGQMAAALERSGTQAPAAPADVAPPSSPPPLPPAPPASGEPPGGNRAAGPTDARKWEERLGARAPVWIGAVALLLAGVFMVRYFAEHGLLGPGVRVGLAGLFGFVLLGAGEWLRRAHAAIGQGLTAAGVGVLYAALLAAVSLHELIGQGTGFVLMAAVTAGAVGLSLRHGPFVALLGLIGGFVMPGLIGAQEEAAAPLFGYLLLLVVGLTVLNRWRGWWWLTLGTMLGGLGWAGLWLVFWYEPAQSALVGLFVLASVAAFVGAAFGVEDRRVAELRVSDLVPWAAVAAGLGMVSLLVGVDGYTAAAWVQMGLLGAGAVVLGALRWRYAGLAALAAATGLVMLAAWGWRDGGSPGAPAGFGWVALAYGALYGAGAYAAMWWRRRGIGGEAARAAPAVWEARLWGWLSVLAVIGYLAVGWWFMDPRDALLPWWLIALLLAAVMAIVAWPVAWRDGRLAKGDEALGALAVGVAALLSFAAHLFVADVELGRQWIGVTWALVMAAALWTAGRLGLAHLRWAGAALAVLIAARLLANPHVLDYEFGDWIVLNWLLYGYGVPIACFALAAWISRRDGAAALGGWLEAGAVALGFVMVTLMVRHGFHAEQIRAAEFTLYESATYSVVWAALALLLAAGAESRRAGSRGILAWWGAAITCLALLMAVVGSGLIVNPARTGEAVGGLVVLNGLLYVYGGPAALLAAAAWQLRRCAARLKIEELQAASDAAGLGSLLLAFGLVTMLVRHGFHPEDMSVRAFALYESATYSTAWAALAAVLAWAGLRAAHGGMTRLGGAVAIAALLMAVIGSGWVLNPVRTGEPVGDVAVFNALLYVYGVPALLLLVAAWCLRQGGRRLRLDDLESASWLAGLGALALAFGMVTLQVRQAFHGTSLAGPAPDNAEWYAYSAAWIVFAAALLAAGVITGGRTLRLASLAVMCGAVLKVFLFDTRHLDDLWRVLSYLGLGVSLMLLAWVYQRFVFARELRKASPQMDADAHG